MGKINILPSSVYNRIAAGEVIERPYSVVKELVENAIDAGATEIEIDVEEGGKSLIRVLDNGTGILREDLPSVFLPHATSKLSKAEDLENILTLGFRGEAVASIASVSELTVKSRTEGAKCYSLSAVGGTLGEIEETSEAFAHGTEVTVSRLFFNAPVRLKFLKTDRGEETDIGAFVSRFILSRPDISFRYFVNGKSVLQSFGEGEEEAFACVYGANVLENCYRIDADKHGVKIRGFIGNQNYTKATKSYQTVFLNGRYISNQTISAAITNAYANYLMKRQYPFYVLHITVPPEIVDVNVHPNKSDVRFSDNKIIYGCVYRVISDVLDGNASALDYVVPSKNAFAPVPPRGAVDSSPQIETTVTATEPPRLSYDEARKAMAEMNEKPKTAPKPTEIDLPFRLNDEEDYAPYVPKSAFPGVQQQTSGQILKNAEEAKRGAVYDLFPDLTLGASKVSLHSPSSAAGKNDEKKIQTAREAYAAAVKEGWESGALSDKERTKNNSEVPAEPDASSAPADAPVDIFAENKKFLLEKEKSERSKQQYVDVSSFVYAGKLFNTYLIYEHGDEVYLIDQHAAHERLIFNRLKAKMQTRQTVCQAMLVPYEISLNAYEGAFLRENLGNIRAMGFEIEETSENTFSVSGVPADLTNIDMAAFFGEIVAEADGYRGIRLEELLRDKLATAACKAAVKGGENLSQAEIDELFRLIDGNLGLRCPHGRPVVARIGKTELEKLFKRVV